VLRIRIADGKVEKVLDLTNLPTTGNVGVGPWLGLDLNDDVLVLKDTGTQDIYSLVLGRALKSSDQSPVTSRKRKRTPREISCNAASHLKSLKQAGVERRRERS
jgi:hypothetical protein